MDMSQGGGGSKKRKGAKGLDVRVEMTGRIEWNGDARKRKKKRRRTEGVMVDRRTARNGEVGEQCMRAGMDGSIVKCMNAVLEKSAIVSLTHGVVSRRSRNGLPKSSVISFHSLRDRRSASPSYPIRVLPTRETSNIKSSLSTTFPTSCDRSWYKCKIKASIIGPWCIFVLLIYLSYFWKRRNHIIFDYPVYYTNLSETTNTSYSHIIVKMKWLLSACIAIQWYITSSLNTDDIFKSIVDTVYTTKRNIY